ncbi:hypothetical protein ACFLS1_04475 [Verrucomicrobiota bacterium]
MKKFLNKGMLLVFCLSLAVPVMQGMAICIGEDGHTAIVATGGHGCCSSEEHRESVPSDSKDTHQLAAEDCCIDIPLFALIEKDLLSSHQHDGFKYVSSCKTSDLTDFVREIRTGKLTATLASASAAYSLARIRTTVLLI